MCGLMVPDTHCPAATQVDDDTRALYCLSYQCKYHQCRANTRGLCWFDPPRKSDPIPIIKPQEGAVVLRKALIKYARDHYVTERPKHAAKSPKATPTDATEDPARGS